MESRPKVPKILDKVLQDSNSVCIEPSESLVFNYCNAKIIVSHLSITNNSALAKMYRVLTSNPQNYAVQPCMDFIESYSTATVTIYMICEKFLLESRLNDKFRVEIIEKVFNDFEDTATQWKNPCKYVSLSIQFQRAHAQSPISSIIQSGLIRSGIREELSCKSPFNASMVRKREVSVNAFMDEEPIRNLQEQDNNFRLKFKNLQQRCNEQQAALIDKYKVDIKDLHNKIEKIQFIYQGDVVSQQVDNKKQLLEHTRIPIWQVLVVSIIFLILGMLIKR